MSTPQADLSRHALAAKRANTPMAGERLISRAELRHFVSASDMALWRWIKAGTFVPPVYIGTRRYWRQSEIEKWLEQQSAAS
jgi:predicted DNA-binding transcriptional regulator AlpA